MLQKIKIPFDVFSDTKLQKLNGMIGFNCYPGNDEDFGSDKFLREYNVSAQNLIDNNLEKYFETYGVSNDTQQDGCFRMLHLRPYKIGELREIRIFLHIRKNTVTMIGFETITYTTKLPYGSVEFLKEAINILKKSIEKAVKKHDEQPNVFCTKRHDIRYVIEYEYSPKKDKETLRAEKKLEKILKDLTRIVDEAKK